MSFPQGINFRLTAGYVTDGANDDAELNAAAYPRTTAQGNSVGWLSNISVNARDRNSGNDARLAGMNFASASSEIVYRIDLPSTGNYNVTLAAGDASFGQPVPIDLYDNNTSLGSLTTGSTSGSQRFKDATNTEYTNVTWPGSNTAVTKTFATTIFQLKVNPGAPGDISCIAHVSVAAATATATWPGWTTSKGGWF